jgi:putative MFS transporter
VTAKTAASTTDRLDRIPIIRYHYFALVLCTVGITFSMYNNFVLPLTIQQLPGSWLASYGIGTILTVNTIGVAIGVLIFGLWADRVGRKRALEVALAVASLNGLLGFVSDPSTFLALRFFGALGVGGTQPVLITYITEITPPRVRGRFVGILLSGMGWAPLLVSLSGLYIAPLAGWRGLYWMCFLPLLVLPLVYAGLQESPRYLLSRGMTEQATRITEKLEKEAHMEPGGLPSGAPPSVGSGKRAQPTISLLFSPAWRKKTVAFIIANGLLIFSFSAWTSWFPSISVMLGYSVSATYVVLTVTSVAQVAGFLVGAFSTDILGRRKTIFVSVPVWALANFLSPFSRNITELCLVSSVLCFAVNVSTSALFSYLSESYPTAIRGTATSATRTISLLGPIAAPGAIAFVLASSQTTAMGIFWSFVLMGVTALLSAIAVIPTGAETAGKSLEEAAGETSEQ